MAKATKTVKAPVVTLDQDKATVAADFATFGKFQVNNDARTAMLRRVTDEAQFNLIRIAAIGAWIFSRINDDAKTNDKIKPIDAARAAKVPTLPNPKAFGNVDKRTETEQVYYKRAGAAWSYYLECNEIQTLNASKATRKGAGARHNDKASAAPVVDNSTTPKGPVAPAAPVTLESVVVTRAPDVATLDAQFVRGAAYFARVQHANAMNLKGDKGAAYRALVIHIQAEVKRIASLKD